MLNDSQLSPFRLKELVTIKHGFAFKGEFFAVEGPFVVLTPGNFFEDGGFRSKGDKEKRYAGEVPEGYILSANDLIVAMTEQAEGLLGSAALVPEDGVYLHNQRLGLVQNAAPELIDSRYLYYLLNTRRIRRQIQASATGTKVRHTSPSRIGEVLVEIPLISTQRQIADTLSAYDDLIENNTRRIAILEEMAQRLYREWFVHFRYPGHESVPFVESELGPIPEGWRVEPLGKVVEVSKDSITSKNAPETIVYVDISSVSTGVIGTTERMRFADAPGRARRRVRHGDIIWSTVRPNRKSYALVLNSAENTVVSTGFAVLRATSIPCEYLYQSVTTDQFVDYLVNRARGAAYPAVNGTDFEEALMLIPAQDTLHSYVGIAAPLLQTASILREQSAAADNLRKLLLPQLILN